MKKILFLLLMLPAMLVAAPVDSQLAQQVAENFFENSVQENVVKHRKASFSPFQYAGRKRILRSSGRTYEPYYIFNNSDGGFVIVAGDDRVQPILAYSANGEFAKDSIPIAVREWLDMYSAQIQYVVDNNISNDSISGLWRTNAPAQVTATDIVAPLIQTHWSQSPLYNDKCPYDAGLSPLGSHPTVGCVACAMGQIMKYWEFPSMGIGSRSYNSANYGTLSANFGRTKYDWVNMPNQLTTSSTQAQIDAVSTLLYHCGVSVDMQYNFDGNGTSGAYTVLNAIGKALRATAEEAFIDYFGYKSSTVQGKFMKDYSYSAWVSLLKNELNNNRPILYSGQSSSGGHAFICDGYDSNDHFHFNWGWGGLYDGNFALMTTPDLILYPQEQAAIIGIIPDQASQAYDLAMYADLKTASSSYTFGNDISITGQVENNGTGTFIGEFRVGLYNSNDQFVGWSNESYSFTLIGGNHTVAKTFTFTGGMPFITGKYTAYMFYKVNGSSQWHSVRSDVGVFLTEYNNVSFNITYKTNALRTYSAFTVLEDKYIVGNSTHINVDILNAGSSTFYGKLKLCLQNVDGTTAQDIDEYNITSGLNANTHYTNGLNFTGVITVDPGTYYLTLLYQRTGETTWYYVGCDQYQNPTPINVVAPPLVADAFEVNDTQSTAASLVPDFEETEMPTFGTGKVSIHTTTDVDYYKVNVPAGYKYYVTIDLYDSYNRNGSNYYSGDAKMAYSIDGQTYSEYFDSGVNAANQIVFEGPQTIYIKVEPYIMDWIGTYELAGHVTREYIDNPSDNILTPGKYVIVANRAREGDRNWYYMTSDLGTASTKRFQAVSTGTESMDAIDITDLEDKYVWTLEADGSNWKLKNGTQYVTWTSGNSANLGTTAKTLTFDVADNQVLAHFNDGSAERYLSLNATTNNNYFAFYSGTNQVEQLFFLPYDDGTTPPVESERYIVLAQRSATSNWLYMTSDLGTASNKRYQAVDAGTSILSNVVSKDLADKYYWEIDGNKLKTAAGYSTWTSGNSANLDATGKELTIQQQTDGTYTFSFVDGDNTRYLALNKTAGNDYFAYYIGTNQIYKLTLVKEGASGTTTSVEDIVLEEQTATKILHNGQIFILRGEKVYNAQGALVK